MKRYGYLRVLSWLFIIILSLDAAAAMTSEQRLKNDVKFKEYAEKRMNRIREDILNGAIAAAQNDVKQAQTYIAVISGEYMKSAEGIRLLGEMEMLSRQVAALAAGTSAPGGDTDEIHREKNAYPVLIGQYEKIITLIYAGKLKSSDGRTYTFDDIAFLRKNLPEFLFFETGFRQRFANLIAAAPDYGCQCCGRDVKVGDMPDLFKNARVYEANFTELVGETEIDRMIALTKQTIERIKKGYPPDSALADTIDVRKKSSRYFDLYIRLKPYYDKVARPLPMRRLNVLADMKTRLGKLVAKIQYDSDRAESKNGN